MKFWYVRHGFDWYQERPDIISWRVDVAEESNNGKAFRSVKKNDKVVYYSHENPIGIIGLFNVEADCAKKILKGGTKPSLYCPISPLYLPNGGKPVKFVAKRLLVNF